MEKRIRTERERFAELLKERPRARILIESSTESEWVARCLEGLGHEVVVEHQKNGRPVEGEGWSGGAEEGRGRESPELCARPV